MIRLGNQLPGKYITYLRRVTFGRFYNPYGTGPGSTKTSSCFNYRCRSTTRNGGPAKRAEKSAGFSRVTFGRSSCPPIVPDYHLRRIDLGDENGTSTLRNCSWTKIRLSVGSHFPPARLVNTSEMPIGRIKLSAPDFRNEQARRSIRNVTAAPGHCGVTRFLAVQRAGRYCRAIRRDDHRGGPVNGVGGTKTKRPDLVPLTDTTYLRRCARLFALNE